MSDATPEESIPVNGAADELIMKQQEAIDKEIATKIPLVGPKESVDVLLKEYAYDEVYQSKIADIGKAYEGIRRTRPDGNCFFRAYCYAILEELLKRPEVGSAFREKIVASKDLLSASGFTQFTIEDFYDTFIATLDRVLSGITEEELYNLYEEPGVSDYLVVFLRILTSAELRRNAEFYQNFIEGGQTVHEFCQLEVEPMYKESDHIHIIALTTALGMFGVRVVYMDRGIGAKHEFPEGSNPNIHILYRPGHYDIIYPRTL